LLVELTALLLLSVFLILNLLMAVVRITGRLAGATLRKTLRIEVPRNEKKNLERLFTIVWVGVGLYGAWKVRWDVLAMAFAFLAFRGGANVSRTLVYSVHDGRIIEESTGERGALRILGRAVRISLLLDGLFVVAFALLYKALSTTANPSGGSKALFILTLWLAGLLFGAAFGWFIARNNRGILLENQIAVVGFFTGKKGKEKTEETLALTRRAGRLRRE